MIRLRSRHTVSQHCHIRSRSCHTTSQHSDIRSCSRHTVSQHCYIRSRSCHTVSQHTHDQVTFLSHHQSTQSRSGHVPITPSVDTVVSVHVPVTTSVKTVTLDRRSTQSHQVMFQSHHLSAQSDLSPHIWSKCRFHVSTWQGTKLTSFDITKSLFIV